MRAPKSSYPFCQPVVGKAVVPNDPVLRNKHAFCDGKVLKCKALSPTVTEVCTGGANGTDEHSVLESMGI